ncbi:MAG: DUF488 domain-containing protein [Microcoleaceae cyanobacterium]
MELFTIGHSNHSIKCFIDLLNQHQITAVADVRSHPYSRYLPHFNQSALAKVLKQSQIYYAFLGRELGARPDNLGCYDSTGKALYERIAKTDLFSVGIQRILTGIKKNHRIALMCAEKDPITCHRTILVCHYLKRYNLPIYHILPQGELESQAQLEQRLLEKYNWAIDRQKVVQLSLFTQTLLEPVKTLDLEVAYQKQSDEIAYKKVIKKN